MSTALVDAHRSDLFYLYGLANTDLLAAWTGFGDPKSTVDGLTAVLPDLVDTYGSAATSLAVDWYAEMRDAAQVAGRFQAIPAELPDLGRTESLAQWASNPLFLADAPDVEAAQVKVSGGLQRIIANSDRETVIGSVAADPKAVRWMRVGSDSACGFCRMLLGRGPIYKSETTGGFKSHDHCGCSVAPGW